MNKKTKIYVIVLIWGAVLLQFFVNGSINREKQMVEEAISSGAYGLSDGSANCYGFYGYEELNDHSRELMASRIAAKLGITSGYRIEHKQDGNNSTTTLTKNGQNGDTCIKIISLSTADGESATSHENYISTDIKLKGDAAKEIYNYKKYIKELYKGLGIDPVTNIYICNEVKGRVDEEYAGEIISEFMDLMDADVIDTYDIDGTLCVYGYSDGIDDYVYQNDSRVNVNIAIDYNEQTDTTYIHKAVPFVDKSF